MSSESEPPRRRPATGESRSESPSSESHPAPRRTVRSESGTKAGEGSSESSRSKNYGGNGESSRRGYPSGE